MKAPQSRLLQCERRIGSCWRVGSYWIDGGERHDMLRTLAFATKPTDSGARLTRFKSLIFQWLTVWPWASDPTSLLGWAQEEPREGFQQVGTGWYNWVCREMGWKEPVWVWRVVICNYTPDPNRLLQEWACSKCQLSWSLWVPSLVPHLDDKYGGVRLLSHGVQVALCPPSPMSPQHWPSATHPGGPLSALPPCGPLISSYSFGKDIP